MLPANVKLSKNELLLVCEEQFILTKNNIIDKVYKLFGLLSIEFAKELAMHDTIFEPELFQYTPKIYKGEQYNALPYVMLDHPRYFNNKDAFSIRCFFWWGNFFSITLHLGGRYIDLYVPFIVSSLQQNKSMSDWYYCINETQWQHDFEATNYKAFTKQSLQTINDISVEKEFFKMAKKIPLQKWDDVYDFYISNFREILNMLKREIK
ncbi:hypothetical protein BH10BAC2_BH10BAC2_05600 [soil metagenome]